ncbi:Small-conductance mechanosensitive channel [Roseimaritima multifibrata]|uniref:Small-conductance mechanosensitive channel n=1 Tax=Roseimaritima multifibrata TaxID=1930274 RepID=A0A517MIP6_9BACT|nr:mechanosensitive ion channel domain-containing protein [Roseimaritima multifibrata]QDS94772.1 Small-conductance mechanosensitive channel [Roseimaritima multifibrata]
MPETSSPAETAEVAANAAPANQTSDFDLMAEIDSIRNLSSEDLNYLLMTYALPAVAALAAILVGYFVAKFVSRVVSAPVIKRVDETLGRFVAKFTFYSLMAGITLGALSKIGAPVTGLAALIAAAGFAVGLAFQGTLSNFASGILLLVFRPFKVGDTINAGGITGKVNEIDLFTVTLDTPDNRRIIVPNSSISGGTIENISFHRQRRVEVLVGVEYSADIEQTRQVLKEAAEAMRSHLIDGPNRGYAIVLDNLGASSVDWKVRFWAASSDYWSVREMLTGEIKQRLDAANIGIPFPQMDIHVISGSDSPETELERQRVRPRPRSTRQTA